MEPLASDGDRVAPLQGGTERPWSSKLNNVKDNGTFRCVCCGESLFKCVGAHAGPIDRIQNSGSFGGAARRLLRLPPAVPPLLAANAD